MDDITYATLNKMQLDKVEIIPLNEFEDENLLSIKSTRSIEEYCWTCTPFLLYYILKKNKDLEMISYLDADLYFYSSCQPIFDEIGNKSVMIIPHRFKPEEKYLEKTKGIYNVSMVSFRNNEIGREVLSWWRERCLEWCYHYYEDGKLGDQLYLNDWPQRFNEVYILKHKGANLAPWNISQYEIKKTDNQIFVNNDPLIFYHFHSLKIYSKSKFQLSYSSYCLSPDDKKIIYRPYLEELKKIIKKIETVNSDFNYGFYHQSNIFKKMKQLIKNIIK